MLMLTVVEFVVYEPPFGLVTVHETESNVQAGGIGVSLMVYVWLKSWMPLNTCVLELVPSSTSEKFASGDGDAVKLKLVDELGIASLMIVIEPGKMTASADSERSCCPPEPFRPSDRM
jgi:hypothetical protein